MENKEFKKALTIGSICITSYIVSYYMRNVLGVLTPEMLETGRYTKEYIGLLSSLYFLVYAAGQLVNGVIGDMINPKKMVSCGLVLSGAASAMFIVLEVKWFQMLCFGLLGFGLSMIRGPLMKIISENTLPKHSRNICVFFSAASFLGSFIASFFALVFEWKTAFVVSGAIAVMVAVAAYVLISSLEKRGLVKYRLQKENKLAGMFSVFKIEKFMFYMFVGMLVEIATASINFWTPTYLAENLHFSNDSANLIFSIMSAIKVIAPFIALGLIKIFGEKDIQIVKYSFLLSAIFFVLMVFCQNAWVNILLFLAAKISAGCASAMLWSIYIPSLGKTGKVSSVNGILDCAGYVAAGIANAIFGFIVDIISWNGIIYIWSGLMLSGFAVAFIVNLKNRGKVQEA